MKQPHQTKSNKKTTQQVKRQNQTKQTKTTIIHQITLTTHSNITNDNPQIAQNQTATVTYSPNIDD